MGPWDGAWAPTAQVPLLVGGSMVRKAHLGHEDSLRKLGVTTTKVHATTHGGRVALVCGGPGAGSGAAPKPRSAGGGQVRRGRTARVHNLTVPQHRLHCTAVPLALDYGAAGSAPSCALAWSTLRSTRRKAIALDRAALGVACVMTAVCKALTGLGGHYFTATFIPVGPMQGHTAGERCTHGRGVNDR